MPGLSFRKKVIPFFLFVLIFFCSGCIRSQEHLIVTDDGSGTLAAQIFVPQGTVMIVDQMLGGMMRGMQKAFGGQQNEMSGSIAEEMFGSQEGMQKAADRAGCQINFLDFRKRKTQDGLTVSYTFEFDDVAKLGRSGILSMKMNIEKTPGGLWVVSPMESPEKIQESTSQMQAFEEFQKTGDFTGMQKAQQQMVEKAFQDLKIVFLLQFPGRISQVSGIFEREDARTARITISGDLLKDPTIVQKIYGMDSGNSQAVWSATGKRADASARPPQRQTRRKEKRERLDYWGDREDGFVVYERNQKDMPVWGDPKSPQPQSPPMQNQNQNPSSAWKTISLKNGSQVKGRLVNETEDFITLSVRGVEVKYYRDEFTSAENLPE